MPSLKETIEAINMTASVDAMLDYYPYSKKNDMTFRYPDGSTMAIVTFQLESQLLADEEDRQMVARLLEVLTTRILNYPYTHDQDLYNLQGYVGTEQTNTMLRLEHKEHPNWITIQFTTEMLHITDFRAKDSDLNGD